MIEGVFILYSYWAGHVGLSNKFLVKMYFADYNLFFKINNVLKDYFMVYETNLTPFFYHCFSPVTVGVGLGVISR